MTHVIVLTAKTIAGRLYLRGGAKMYTRDVRQAAKFAEKNEAERHADDLRRLLALLPDRPYTVEVVQEPVR